MKKFLILGLALSLAGGVAYANFCARDYVPAATLLVPYVVVSLAADGVSPDLNGYTTLLAVTNVSSDAQLIHVTVWNARSSTVVDFDEVLTGYDVWSINFRDLIQGRFDRFDTGTTGEGFWYPGEDPEDTIVGPDVVAWGPTANNPLFFNIEGPQDYDDPDFYLGTGLNPDNILRDGCGFPYGDLSSLAGQIVAGIKRGIRKPLAALYWCRGTASLTLPTWLTTLTSNPLFFYVTVDVVNLCSTAFPNQSGYWTGRIPSSENVLIGDIIYVNQTARYSESVPAVSLEADVDAANTTYFAFYDRYTPGGIEDDRENLEGAHAFRYLQTGGVTTEAVVWKSTREVFYSYLPADYDDYNSDLGLDLDAYFEYACEPYLYYAWDENENSKQRGSGPSGFDTLEPNAFPFETQSVPVTVGNFYGLMSGNGWMLIIWDSAVPILGYGNWYWHGYPPTAWVAARYLLGGYSTMTEAAIMANPECFYDQTLLFYYMFGPFLGVNYQNYVDNISNNDIPWAPYVE